MKKKLNVKQSETQIKKVNVEKLRPLLHNDIEIIYGPKKTQNLMRL